MVWEADCVACAPWMVFPGKFSLKPTSSSGTDEQKPSRGSRKALRHSGRRNLAANRQTRMLADLALVGCYNKTYMPAAERDRIMLASAKRNLAAMSYFGLTEYQKISQYIFEETFNLRFAIPFEQHNTTVSTVTMNSLTPAQRNRIDQLNALDIELYAFAKKLMFQRFERLKAKDNDFEVRFAHLGNLGVRSGVTEFNWDSNIDDLPSNEHH
ncbi:heparan sulfate 6-o-sulfotransferase [Anopheles darlingi]|uniref:Heparan-sulfate 6-O-sulfotransferase n=1 Tax=Anopheles darlingi TaxID=43151 RepID=W5J977_ANODA|nr:heparan sulfate 6-o-sulfotransferase [Anopheles darlingi]